MTLLSRNLALLAILSIVVMVFSPPVCGPFTATYGPASALRAIVFAALVILSLTHLWVLQLLTPQLRRCLECRSTEPDAVLTLPAPVLRC